MHIRSVGNTARHKLDCGICHAVTPSCPSWERCCASGWRDRPRHYDVVLAVARYCGLWQGLDPSVHLSHCRISELYMHCPALQVDSGLMEWTCCSISGDDPQQSGHICRHTDTGQSPITVQPLPWRWLHIHGKLAASVLHRCIGCTCYSDVALLTHTHCMYKANF